MNRLFKRLGIYRADHLDRPPKTRTRRYWHGYWVPVEFLDAFGCLIMFILLFIVLFVCYFIVVEIANWVSMTCGCVGL